MVGPIFNLFFLNDPHLILNTFSLIRISLFGLFGLVSSVCSVYSVDKMYLELNEDHLKKKRLKIGLWKQPALIMK